jgi:predicted transcriptional regulator
MWYHTVVSGIGDATNSARGDTMGRPRGKVETVGVHMRLPVEVVARLDELAESTAGSRGDVVRLLVQQAEVRRVVKSVPTITLASGEAVADD